MLGTLFFDEIDTNSVLHVRPNRQHHAEDVSVNNAVIGSPATRHAPCFPTSGSIQVFSLRATLLWWLDRDTALMHLMLTSSTPGGVSYCCRKLSVEIPVSRSAVIACGVTHIREETVFAVTWVTSQLEVGILRVQLQRGSDSQSHLLIVPDGKVVLTSRPQRIIEAFEKEAKTRKCINGAAKKDSEDGAGVWDFSLSACILARLPSQTTPANLLSMIFLTNGVDLWKIEVGEDGTFTEIEIAVSKGRIDSTTNFLRRSSISSWLPLWSWDNKHGNNQQYACVNAVQQTELIALQGSSGLLELYDSAAGFATPIFSCLLWEKEYSPCGEVEQWVSLINKHIHVLTCIGGREACRYIWLRIPFTFNDDSCLVAERFSVIPPAATSTLLGCEVVDNDNLTLLWDIGPEEDACISPSISIGSLLHSTQQGVSGILQTIATQGRETNQADDYDDDDDLNPRSTEDEACWRKEAEAKHRHADIVSMFLKNTEVFFCHSGPLHALTSVGNELVLMESVNGSVRAHVLCNEMNSLEYFTEVSFAVSCLKMPVTSNSLLLRSIHLTPAVVSVGDRPVSKDSATFEEGVALAASCADGADNFAALLISAVQNVPVALSAGAFRLLCSSAYLQGYTPSGFVDEVTMNLALDKIVTYVDVPSRTLSFCSFSRRFVQHTISRDILSRISYLLCSYIGWLGSNMESLAVMELPRFRITLEFLSAAYHVVSVAGPYVASIASVVRETLIEDVLQFFLGFKNGLKRKSDDAVFAVHVARRLQECDGVVGMRACATWCNLLCRRYPSLQHFKIVRDLEVGRLLNSSLFANMCLAASFHLASLPQEDSVLFLCDGGLDVGSKKPLLSVFDGVDVNEWRTLLVNTSLVAKTYRVAILRFVISSGDTQYTSMSGSLVQELFLTELMELEQYLRLSGLGSSKLYRALLELCIDTHMFLARAALDESTLGDVFCSLEKVLRNAEVLNISAKYSERVFSVVAQAVELAALSQKNTDAIINLTHSSTELDNILTLKWYIYIARLATKMTSRDTYALLMRAVTGLYRFLCRRHAYGQAARMMTDLSTIVRCSASFSSSTLEAVLEMTALAVTVAELIAPTAPLQEEHNTREEPLTLVAYDFASYLQTQEQTTSKAPLTRDYIPWLRRRHFQAFCEKKLMDARRRVNCTDLWAENPSTEAHVAAVKRFVEVLMESHFWTEARRFAVMSGYDVSFVFQEHVLHLLSSTDYSTDDVALQEWREMIQECEALSSPANRFDPLRRTLITAFMYDFKKTHPALLSSLEQMNCYVAMQALVEVFETLFHRRTEVWKADAAIREDEEEEVAANGAGSSLVPNCNDNGSMKQCNGEVVRSAAQLWFPLVEALRIGSDVLTGCLHNREGNIALSDASITAGLFDPLAYRAHELLDSSLLLEQLGETQTIFVAKGFLKAFDALKKERLAIM